MDLLVESLYLCMNIIGIRNVSIARNVHSRSAGRPTIHLLKEQGKQLFPFYGLLSDRYRERSCNSSDFHQGSKRLCSMPLMGNPLLPWRE